MLFWRYWKDMQTYFGYFRYAWLHAPKIIVSTCRGLWCLSSCQKCTSWFTSFLRYYILKNPVIWLADSILAHNLRLRILPNIGFVVKYQNNIIFYFRLFPRKTSDKILQNNQKIIFWGTFWALFTQTGASWALSVFKYYNYLPSCQKLQQTDRHTTAIL